MIPSKLSTLHSIYFDMHSRVTCGVEGRRKNATIIDKTPSGSLYKLSETFDY